MRVVQLFLSEQYPFHQGRSDGGKWVYIPPKSVQVDFLWGENDARTAIKHEY